MAKINIEYSSNYNAEETFNKIKSLIENNKDLEQIDKNYSCSFNDSALSGHAKGKQFEAELKVLAKSESQSDIEFNIKLGLMLTPFKGVVEEKLLRKLQKMLG